MKNKLSLYLLVSISILIGACTDLDLTPKESSIPNAIFIDANAYKSYLAKLYGSFILTGQDGPAGAADLSIINDEGFSSYIRVLWKAQQLTTDETVISWTDAGIQDLHKHKWSSTNQFVRVLYYRILFSVALANDFLTQSSSDNMDKYGISSGDQATVNSFSLEARFLRALAYYHALDMFRNVPLLTKITTEIPSQASPQELFGFVESELNDIENSLPDPRANEYGRADKAAVWMLKAKLYLNADVFIGQDRYSDCVAECKKVIDAGYTLNSDYKTLFMADNHTSTEVIFSLISDGVNSKGWGGTTFLVNGAVGGSMSGSDYGLGGNGWGGMRTTSTMVANFDVGGSQDPRAIFFTSGQKLEIESLTEFTDGYAVPKYSNKTSTGEDGSDGTHPDTDFPMFRLADAYLMYAEAVLRGGSGGTQAEAVTLINELRERAYGNSNANITSGDLTLDFILDERTRELYWEGHRRQDLIRYGQFTDQGIWPWKGDVKEGVTTEKFRDIFPIPASDLNANPNLNQNTGY